MTSAAKAKDKPLASPRLLPRATAASAARAAHNATSRTNAPLTTKQSQNRLSPIVSNKGKKSIQNVEKSDSKTDVKINNNAAIDQSDTVHKTLPAPMTSELFIIDNNPPKVLQRPAQVQLAHDTDAVSALENQNNPDESSTLLSSPSRPNSHPQTSMHVDSSKPQTSSMPSRPTTPSHPMQRHGTLTSRPNTPQRPNTPVPKTPSISVSPCSRVMSPLPSPDRAPTEEDIEFTFTEKQKQFHRLKKELDLKQQIVLKAFDNLRALREQMITEGLTGCGEGFQLQELEVFNVADWTSEEIAELCRDASSSSAADGAIEFINNTLPIDESALVDLDTKVLNVPTHFADLCLQAFTARQEVIDWVKELIEKNENGSGEYLVRIAQYNNHGLELCEALRSLKAHADSAVDTIRHLTKRALHDRGALVAVGESLVREIARLRQEMETHNTAIKDLQESRSCWNRNDGHREYDEEQSLTKNELLRELEEERAQGVAIKEKLAIAESQLRQSRLRITKMDRQLREAEASITGLTSTVKSMEDQSRQKEVQLEARARKLKETVRAGEMTSNQITQQRNALQNEVQELKQQIETMTAQHKTTIQEMNAKLKETKLAMEEEHQKVQNEIIQRSDAALLEAQNTIEELRLKITQLENSKPNPELPTEREMDLWAELQATKETLRTTEDEVVACKREKIRFLETLTKITDTDNKVGIQQKLAAELLSKEEIMGKMQIQMRELMKNIKLNEQKLIQYEQYVRELQEHNRAIANNEGSPGDVSYQDLQQEVMTLRISLLEAIHRNEELSEQLVQNEQQIEQQEKTSRAQAKIIKVREELINMLKNKETEQSRELATLQQDLEHRMKIVDDVNKQIAAKADEIQELFTTLENKQQQIHRLEKIVLALEEQQRRAQAQRTRHEEKIAALEHEISANGNRKERKFLFF